MKKSIYLALAAVTLTLFACNSKPADSDQQAEEQTEQIEQVEQVPVEEPAEEPAAEQPAEEPAAEEPAAEQPAEEAPAAPSDKFEIARSDGNFIAFRNEVVTADADGCFDIAVVFDKKEESNIRVVVEIKDMADKRIGLFPFAIAPGGTKASVHVCASMGGVLSAIQPGEQYKLSFTRVQLQ